MARPISIYGITPMVMARMFGAVFLLAVAVLVYFAYASGMIPQSYAEREADAAERRELKRLDAEIKRLIARRNATAAAIRSADGADRAAQAARDAPPPAPTPAPTPEAPAVPFVLPAK